MTETNIEKHIDILSKNMVVARKANGITQAELSKRSGVSRATIAQLEGGEGDPKLSTLVSISEVLGVPPWLLMAGETDMIAIADSTRRISEPQLSKIMYKIEGGEVANLLNSGTLKKRVKAAKLGVSAIKDEKNIFYPLYAEPADSKHAQVKIKVRELKTNEKASEYNGVVPVKIVNTGMISGASIGTTLLPGLGTLLGAFIVKVFEEQDRVTQKRLEMVAHKIKEMIDLEQVQNRPPPKK